MSEYALSAVFSIISSTLAWCAAKQELREEVEVFRDQIQGIQWSLDFLMKDPKPLHKNLINLLGMLKDILTEACDCCEKLQKKSKKVWNMKPKKQLAALAKLDKRLKNIIPSLTLALAGTDSITSNAPATPPPKYTTAAPSAGAARPPRRTRRPPRRPTNMRSVSKSEQEQALAALTPAKFIFDPKALQFWTRHFGQELQATSPKMMKAFSQFRLTSECKDTLRLWIDADGDGICTIYEYAKFLEQFGGLKEAIDMAKGERKPPPPEDPQDKLDIQILWVGGDANEDNQWMCQEARKKGLKIQCVGTCEAAIDLLEDNEHLLFSKDDEFRILTNNVNYNENTDMIDKGQGGASEALIKFARRRRCLVPILVYCNYTLPIAIEFTKKYRKNVFATNVEDTAEAFLHLKPLPAQKVSQY